jgi:hypothetical protein
MLVFNSRELRKILGLFGKGVVIMDTYAAFSLVSSENVMKS